MKGSVKILSVILIIASVFGIVGGGIGLADVLECKAYWEDKSAVSTADLATLEDGLNTLAENKQTYIDGLAAYEKGTKDYEDGQKTLEDGKKEYEDGQKTLEEKTKEYNDGLNSLKAAEKELAEGKATLEANKEAYAAGKAQLAAYSEADIANAKQAYSNVKAEVDAGASETEAITAVATAMAKATIEARNDEIVAGVTAQVDGNIDLIKAGVLSEYQNGVAKTLTGDPDATYADLSDDGKAAVNAYIATPEGAAKYEALVAQTRQSKIDKGVYDTKQDLLMQNLPAARTQVNTAYTNYPALEKGLAQIAEYEAGQAKYEAGLDKYYAGRQQLVNGKAQLDEGKAKLEAAEKTIKEGEKSLTDAEKQLADGKAKLEEFEAGQKQAIDGIETVLASETYGNLVSIADRLGPDYKYLDSKDMLDTDQGLAAVAAAREFSAENGAVVTKELTARAVGAVLAIIAGVAALVAGAMGLIGTAKIAGIIAAASAVVAVIAAIVTAVAGSTMSAVAGSTVAAIVIAAGAVVAVVAAVHAVGLLAPKKAAV